MHHRSHKAEPTRFELPIPFVDVFLLLLLLVLAFRVDPAKLARLPVLLGGEGATPAASPGPPPVLVELDADGQVRLGGTAVPLEKLGENLAVEGSKGRAIHLAIETRPDGTGQLRGFLEIQTDFSRRGLWARTAVLHRPKGAVETR